MSTLLVPRKTIVGTTFDKFGVRGIFECCKGPEGSQHQWGCIPKPVLAGLRTGKINSSGQRLGRSGKKKVCTTTVETHRFFLFRLYGLYGVYPSFWTCGVHPFPDKLVYTPWFCNPPRLEEESGPHRLKLQKRVSGGVSEGPGLTPQKESRTSLLESLGVKNHLFLIAETHFDSFWGIGREPSETPRRLSFFYFLRREGFDSSARRGNRNHPLSFLSLLFCFAKQNPAINQGISLLTAHKNLGQLEQTSNFYQGNPLLKINQGNPNNQGKEGQGCFFLLLCDLGVGRQTDRGGVPRLSAPKSRDSLRLQRRSLPLQKNRATF